MKKNLFKEIVTLSAEELGAAQELELQSEDHNEVAMEEVEAYEATDEMLADADQDIELAEDIEDTVTDTESLGELYEEASNEAAEEGSEGMEPVTALSIRATLRVIANNTGIPMPKVCSAITKQSFNGGTKLRIANTKIVLAGIKDVLVELWEKIKAGLKLLWKRITDFWKKHFSTLGRLKKALESGLKKAKSLKGTPDYTKEVKAGSGLNNLFIESGELDVKLIGDYFSRHKEASKETSNYISGMNQWLEDVIALKDGPRPPNVSGIGSDKKTLAGGVWFKVEVDEAEDEKEGTAAKLSMTREIEQTEASDERKITVASKSQMETILKAAIECVKDTMKHGEEFGKLEKKYQKNVEELNKAIDKAEQGSKTTTASNIPEIVLLQNKKQRREARKAAAAAAGINIPDTPTKAEAAGSNSSEGSDNNTTDSDLVAKLKAATRAMQSGGTVIPKLNSGMASVNIKLCKGTLQFVKMSMKVYKK